MKINKPEQKQVEVETIRLCLKVRDIFTCTFEDRDGNEVGWYEGYVPDFFPGQHYGDYVELDIDIATGQVTNWRMPTAENVEELLNGRGGEWTA